MEKLLQNATKPSKMRWKISINEIWNHPYFHFQKRTKTNKKRHKNLTKLTKVVNDLANDIPLDIKYKDHALISNSRFMNCRECHIETDWLLVYKKNKKDLILFLIETGTHSDLF